MTSKHIKIIQNIHSKRNKTGYTKNFITLTHIYFNMYKAFFCSYIAKLNKMIIIDM